MADIWHCPACGTPLIDWYCPYEARDITVAEMQAAPIDDPPEKDYDDE